MSIVKAILVTLALWAAPVFAQDVGGTEDPCITLGVLSTTVMDARQRGVSLGDIMTAAQGNDILQAITLAAYQVPRFTTEEYQQQAIADFGNEIMLACYEGME